MLSNDFSELWVVECVNKKVPTLRSRVAVCVCVCLLLLPLVMEVERLIVIGDVVFSFNNTAYYVASGSMMKVNKV